MNNNENDWLIKVLETLEKDKDRITNNHAGLTAEQIKKHKVPKRKESFFVINENVLAILSDKGWSFQEGRTKSNHAKSYET
jgi:hypothetical protein